MIIGLTGPQGGGKDTIADGLVSLFEVDKRRFSETLYAMAACFEPVFHPAMAHSDKEDYLLGDPSLGTRREFLEKLGTEFGRYLIHPDVWVMRLMASIEASKLPTVICDVRFENEADAIRRAGGMIIHLIPDWTDFGYWHPSDCPLPKQSGDFLLHLVEGQLDEGIQRAGNHVMHHYGAKARLANRPN